MSTFSLADFIDAVPRLEPDGSNWIIFKLRFLAAVCVMDVEAQFHGTNPKPPLPGKATVGENTQRKVDTSACNTALAAWEEKENLAQCLLNFALPDSLLVRHLDHPTVAETWSALEEEFIGKTMMIKAHLYSEFVSMRYENGADLRAEFGRVRMKRWELLNYGIEISKQDYLFMIINFVGNSFSDFLAQMFAIINSRCSTWAEGTKAESEIEPETLMRALTEEWVRRCAVKERRGKERRPNSKT